MSEAGRQLVENERGRRAVMQDAKRLLLEVLVKLTAETEGQLAELDIDGARVLIERIAAKRQTMRELITRQRELAAAAASE